VFTGRELKRRRERRIKKGRQWSSRSQKEGRGREKTNLIFMGERGRYFMGKVLNRKEALPRGTLGGRRRDTGSEMRKKH